MCLTAFVRGGRSPTLPHNDARLHSASQLRPITHRAAHSEQLQGSSGGSAVQCEEPRQCCMYSILMACPRLTGLNCAWQGSEPMEESHWG